MRLSAARAPAAWPAPERSPTRWTMRRSWSTELAVPSSSSGWTAALPRRPPSSWPRFLRRFVARAHRHRRPRPRSPRPPRRAARARRADSGATRRRDGPRLEAGRGGRAGPTVVGASSDFAPVAPGRIVRPCCASLRPDSTSASNTDAEVGRSWERRAMPRRRAAASAPASGQWSRRSGGSSRVTLRAISGIVLPRCAPADRSTSRTSPRRATRRRWPASPAGPRRARGPCRPACPTPMPEVRDAGRFGGRGDAEVGQLHRARSCPSRMLAGLMSRWMIPDECSVVDGVGERAQHLTNDLGSSSGPWRQHARRASRPRRTP